MWREKIGAPGISTELIKDQYGVIRRTDIDDIVDALSPGTRIVYFLPENRHDDRTIRVEQVETTLRISPRSTASTCGSCRSLAGITPARRATPTPTWLLSMRSTGPHLTGYEPPDPARASLPIRRATASPPARTHAQPTDPCAQSMDTSSPSRPSLAPFSASHCARNSSASRVGCSSSGPGPGRTVRGFLLGPAQRPDWLLRRTRLQRVPGEPGAGLGHIESDEVGLDLGEVLGGAVPSRTVGWRSGPMMTTGSPLRTVFNTAVAMVRQQTTVTPNSSPSTQSSAARSNRRSVATTRKLTRSPVSPTDSCGCVPARPTIVTEATSLLIDFPCLLWPRPLRLGRSPDRASGAATSTATAAECG